jgi:hypothetical protein
MLRLSVLTLTAVFAFSGQILHANDNNTNAIETEKSFYARTVDAIKEWYGKSTLQPIPDAPQSTATMEEKLNIWFGKQDDSIQDIEPAAGTEEDTLQIPPPYTPKN